MSFDIRGVGARYGGREPAWEYRTPNLCAGGPDDVHGFFSTVPATSTECAGQDRPCDPMTPTPCCDETHRCSGADGSAYRCYPPCDPVRCYHGPPDGTADMLGACITTDFEGSRGVPLCWAVAPAYATISCTPGERGCTTQHGVSENTICFEKSGDTRCAELCLEEPAASCAASHQCVPLPFEHGGVCSRP